MNERTYGHTYGQGQPNMPPLCGGLKNTQNYTTLYTENPIKNSVLFFKLVKTVSNSSYIAKLIPEKGLYLKECSSVKVLK